MSSRQAVFCVLLAFAGVTSSSTFAQEAKDEAPRTLLNLGHVGVKNGKFNLIVWIPYTEEQTQNYTVQVPVTIELADKTTKTEFRTETRMRTVNVTRLKREERPVADEAISFSTVAGKKVNSLEVVRRMLSKKSRPAFIQYSPEPIGAYYQQFLNPELVIVVHIDPRKNTPAPAK